MLQKNIQNHDLRIVKRLVACKQINHSREKHTDTWQSKLLKTAQHNVTLKQRTWFTKCQNLGRNDREDNGESYIYLNALDIILTAELDL